MISNLIESGKANSSESVVVVVVVAVVVRDEFLPNGRNTEPFSWRGIAPHGRLARQTTQPQ